MARLFVSIQVKFAAERVVVHAAYLHEPAQHSVVLHAMQAAVPVEPRKAFVDFCRRAVAKLDPDSEDEGEK